MSPLILALLASLAWSDPLVDGLIEEADRTKTELKLGDADPPYFVAFDLSDGHHASVAATLGGVVYREDTPKRMLGVAVRAGTPQVDSANFDDAWSGDGFRSRTPTLGQDPYALRHTAWYEADRAYKEALENLARREAARARMAKAPEAPCFAPGEPRVSESDPAEPVSADVLQPIAVRLSEVFLDHPQIEWSRVFTRARSGRRVIVDTYGTRVIKPEALVVVRATARMRAADGTWITDHASWVVRTPDDLPPLNKMVERTERMAVRLEGWAAAPLAEDDYVGPVLFEESAAIELVRALALPVLSGTPPTEKAPKGSRIMSLGDDGADTVRVKRRLLPSGFHLIDDPTADPRLPSSYSYDDEGVQAERIKLVDDGVIRTHYASRTPSEEVPRSNGHARGAEGTFLRGQASQTRLEVDRGLSDKKLHKQALALAEDYDLDHYVVIRRVEDSAVSSVASKVMFDFGEEGGMGQPVEVVKRYADGREEQLRGWTLVGVDHRLLRDVVAAGTESHRNTVLQDQLGEYSGGITGGLPTTIATPSLLVGEVELRAGGGSGEKPPALPSPLATSKP